MPAFGDPTLSTENLMDIRNLKRRCFMMNHVLGATVGIPQFFTNLFNDGLAPALYAIAAFFFALGCIGLMLPGERQQQNAKANLYMILGSLAFALLTSTIISIIQTAAGGTPTISPPPR
jgi:hypothetical protein